MCARSFEILFVAAVRDAGSRRARRKAAFAGLGSKVHHRAVQLLAVSARLQACAAGGEFSVGWLRHLPPARPPAITSRGGRSTGPAPPAAKQSAQSHTQSAFARSPNGGGGEDVPAVLGG